MDIKKIEKLCLSGLGVIESLTPEQIEELHRDGYKVEEIEAPCGSKGCYGVSKEENDADEDTTD